MGFTDTNNDGLLSVNFAMRSAEVVTASVLIDCVTGFSLFGQSVSDIAVEARQGVSGAFTNIETTPIDLGTWNGTRQLFHVRLTAGSIVAYTRRTFTLTVRRPT